MPAVLASQLWFREESETRPNTNLVHAFMEDDPEAFCKEARWVGYRCETFDHPPEGSNVHDVCQKAVDERNKT